MGNQVAPGGPGPRLEPLTEAQAEAASIKAANQAYCQQYKAAGAASPVAMWDPPMTGATTSDVSWRILSTLGRPNLYLITGCLSESGITTWT